MKYLFVFVLCFGVSTSVKAACHAGQMTKSIGPAEVTNKGSDGITKIISLEANTEIHVLEVTSDKIEIYVATNENGQEVNGLGVVNPKLPPVLYCQQN